MKMTDSEAIEILKYYDEQPYFFSKDASADHAFKMAIAAFEEVQQYREIIGLTPEDLKALEKDEIQTIGDALKAFAEWSQYKEIGTVEECEKAMKEYRQREETMHRLVMQAMFE